MSVPYPEPTSAAASKIGTANRRKDTRCEVRFRSELHSLGMRFRKDFAVVVAGRSIRVDVAFTRARVAVFVDGCFWHWCPVHGRMPKSNLSYRQPKLRRNRDRDSENDAALNTAGWRTIRIWEHDDLGAAARRIETVVRPGS